MKGIGSNTRMVRRSLRFMGATSALALALGSASMVSAQDQADEGAAEDENFVNTIVVIGNQEQPLIEATNPFTQITSDTLELQAPRSVADALINVPSLQIDPSFGPSNNQFRFRGIGAGGTQFLEFEEDGIPIQRDAPDFFYRISNAIESIDVVRGGVSPIYRSGALGATINFKYKEGSTEEFEGDVYFQLSDFGQRRAEVFLGGPLAENTSFAVSGWYSQDDGIREVDFNANEGFNIRASVKHEFSDGSGHFKVSGRYTEEANLIYFVGNPLLGSTSDPQPFPGGPDIGDGTQLSREILQFNSQSAPGVENFVDNTNGEDTVFGYVGAEFMKEWDSGFSVVARARYTDSNGKFAGQFASGFAAGGADFQTGDQLVSNLLTAGFPSAGGVGIYQQALPAGFAPTSYQLVNRSGDVLDSGTLAITDTNGDGIIDAGEVAAASTLGSLANGNGIFTPIAVFTQSNPFQEFQVDLEASYEFSTGSADHRVAVGYYYDQVDRVQDGTVSIFLTDLQQQSRLVDVQITDGTDTVLLTDQGLLAHNIFPGGFRIDDEVNAGYFVYEGDFGDLKIDGGLRVDQFRSEQAFFGNESVFGTNTNQLPLPVAGSVSPATLAIQRRTGPNSPNADDFEVDETFVSYTIGGNYLITPDLGVYARYTDSGLPFAGAVSRTDQIELGARFQSGGFAVAGNFFRVNQESDQLTFGCQDANQNLVNCVAFRDNRTTGFELESQIEFLDMLRADINFTYQDPTLTITDIVFQSDNSQFPGDANPFDGNQTPQQPNVLGTFGLTWDFDIGEWSGALNGTARYVGSRFVNNENTNELESYVTVGVGLVVNGPDGWYGRVNVQNLTNEDALQDAFGGIGGFGTFTGSLTDGFYGRPLFGRNVIFGIGKSF